MEAGELEIRKAFEDVTRKNVKSSIEHGNETRRICRELQTKVSDLEKKIVFINKQLVDQNKIISGLQVKLYKNGIQ